MSQCFLDIVIAVDLSGSTKGPGSGPSNAYPGLPQLDYNTNYFGHANLPYEAQRIALEGLIDYFTPGMLAHEIQVGVVFWGTIAVPLEVGGPGSGIWMTTDPYGVLSTAKTVQAPDGQMHSPIAYEMWRHSAAKEPGSPNPPYVGQVYNNGVGVSTDLATAMDSCFSHGSAWNPPGTSGLVDVNSTQSNRWNWISPYKGIYKSPTGDGVGILQLTHLSDLASNYPARENDPSYRKVGLIITDSGASPQASGVNMWQGAFTTPPFVLPAFQGALPYNSNWPPTGNRPTTDTYGGCTYQSNSLTPITSSGSYPGPWNVNGDPNQYVMGAVCSSGAFLSQPTTGVGSQMNIIDTLDCLTCNHNSGNEPWNTSTTGENFGSYIDSTDPSAISNFASLVVGPACGHIPSWDCSGPNQVTVGNVNYPPWSCYDPGNGLGAWGPNSIIHPNSTYNDCLNNCDPPESYSCSGQYSVSDINGNIIPPWTCFDPGNGNGAYSNSTICQNNCNPAITLQSCSMAGGAIDPVTGAIVPPWTCYDDPNGTLTPQQCSVICQPLPSWNCIMDHHTGIGTCVDPQDGSGQYSIEQNCIDICIEHRYIDPEFPTGGFKSWDCVTNWKPTFAGGGLSYNCVGLNNTSGQYTTEQDCLDNCFERQYIDPHFPTGSTWKCHIPWQQTIGVCTEIPNSAGTNNAGPYTTEQDCLDACRIYTVDPVLPTIEGWDCVNNQCVGPVMGGQYPTEAACLAICGTIGVGTLVDCYTVRACPCGWDWHYSTLPQGGQGVECKHMAGVGGQGLGSMPAIEVPCMMIENLLTAPIHDIPVPGDVFEHTSPASNPALYTWTEAYVVDSILTLPGAPSLETRSTNSCIIPTPL